MGVFQPIFFCVFVNLLVGVLSYGVNFLIDFVPAEVKLPGVLALAVSALILAFSVVSFLPGVKQRNNWTFKLAVFFFIMTSFDFVTIVDLVLETQNRGFLLTRYLHSGDALLENEWTETLIYFDGLLPHLLHCVIFYRIFNGQAWRSLYLFNATAWLAMCPPFLVALLSPETQELYGKSLSLSWAILPLVPVVVVAFIRALTLPKSAGDARKGGKAKAPEVSGCCSGLLTSRLFKLLNALVTLQSLAILGTQAVIALDVELDLKGFSLRDFYGRNNPMLEFETLPQIIPFGVINVWMYVGTVIPISIIHLLGSLQTIPRAFLWDLAVIQTAVVCTGQVYCFAPFLPSNPEGFQAELTNPLFWLVNLLPVLASLLNLLRLSPYHRNDQTSLKVKRK